MAEKITDDKFADRMAPHGGTCSRHPISAHPRLVSPSEAERSDVLIAAFAPRPPQVSRSNRSAIWTRK